MQRLIGQERAKSSDGEDRPNDGNVDRSQELAGQPGNRQISAAAEGSPIGAMPLDCTLPTHSETCHPATSSAPGSVLPLRPTTRRYRGRPRRSSGGNQ